MGRVDFTVRTVWTVFFGSGGGKVFGFGVWVWGGKVRFWRVDGGVSKLFHVEQLEIGRNDEGFGRFLTVRRTDFDVKITVLGSGFYGEIFAVTVTVEGLLTNSLVPRLIG